MKLIALETKLPVVNHDPLEVLRKEKRHGDLLPDTVRGLIVGPSNCGKTNAVVSLIEHPNGLRFQNLIIVSKSLDQPKYKRLQSIIEPLEEIKFFGMKSESDIPETPLPDSVFVFDDLIGCDQTMMQKYFSYGRHLKVDSIFISQTYCSIKKHLLRDNANFICLFKQDDVNLKHVFDEHVSGASYKQFKEMCDIAWKESHGFITIDKDANNIRIGFDKVFSI